MNFHKSRTAHLRLGRRGERTACRFLRGRNFDILLRNYRTSSGEIDLVARDGMILCFIEVRTRRSTSKSRPAQGLSERQKKRICDAAMHYLGEISSPSVPYRFDLVEVILSGWALRELRHWPSHFTREEISKAHRF
jgi:putative endonuclease